MDWKEWGSSLGDAATRPNNLLKGLICKRQSWQIVNLWSLRLRRFESFSTHTGSSEVVTRMVWDHEIAGSIPAFQTMDTYTCNYCGKKLKGMEWSHLFRCEKAMKAFALVAQSGQSR